MIKKIYTYILFIIIIFFMFNACKNENNKTKVKQSIVETPKKTQQKDINFIECRGYITPKYKFNLKLRAGERIIKYKIKENEYVKKGQPLVWLTNDSLLNQVISQREREFEIKKDIEELKIQAMEISILKNDIERLKKQILEERNIAKLIKDYPLSIQEKKITDEIVLKTKKLNILTSKKLLNENLINDRKKIQNFSSSHTADITRRLNKLIVKAPFSGKIAQVNQNPDWASTGETILEMWNENELLVKAEVWQHQIQHIKINDNAKVFPDYYTNYKLNGKVIKIGNAIHSNRNDEYPRFPIVIKLNKIKNNKLRVGMVVLIKINIKNKKISLLK